MWGTVKTFFKGTVRTGSKISLIEKKKVQREIYGKVMIEEVISNDYNISETFDKIFSNIVLSLKIIHNENFKTTTEYEMIKFNTKSKKQIQKSKISFAQFRTMNF